MTATTAPPATMAADAAAWVWDNVLSPQQRDSKTRGNCMCQYTACGACQRGRHDHCISWRPDGGLGAKPFSDAILTDRKSFIRGPELWRVGVPCSYQCACPQCRPARRRVFPPIPSPGNPPAARAPRLVQTTLFDLAGWDL